MIFRSSSPAVIIFQGLHLPKSFSQRGKNPWKMLGGRLEDDPASYWGILVTFQVNQPEKTSGWFFNHPNNLTNSRVQPQKQKIPHRKFPSRPERCLVLFCKLVLQLALSHVPSRLMIWRCLMSIMGRPGIGVFFWALYPPWNNHST